jgi:hypothetical protein
MIYLRLPQPKRTGRQPLEELILILSQTRLGTRLGGAIATRREVGT